MVEHATSVNPEVLQWARKQAGLSIEDVAERLKKPADLIESWESGSDAPTYGQLEILAVRYYKRPIAVFFFPAPPDEPSLSAEFRTLPDTELEGLDPTTRYAIREARSFQESLRALASPPGPNDPYIMRDISAGPEDSIVALARTVREYLGVTLEEQTQFRDADTAFKRWRVALEDVGISVFKGSIKQKPISGFCLQDPAFPVIYINNGSSFSRQLFTLFHELAHLLLSTSGITTTHTAYIDDLVGLPRQVETACNRFASAFLVPAHDFDPRTKDMETSEEAIRSLADHYAVSREVIARCFLDRNRISKAEYKDLSDRWNEEYRQQGRGSGGGNYYATKASYLGDRYLRLAFSSYREGKLSIGELAEHLGVKARNIGSFEDFLVGRV